MKILKSKKPADKKVNIDDNALDVFDMIVPDTLKETDNNIYLGKNIYSRTYAIATYPREIYVGWLDEFFQLGNIRISAYIENIPDSLVINTLTKKVVSAQSQLYIYETRGDIHQIPILRTVISDLETVREAIQTNRDRMFIAKIDITVFAKTEDALEEKCYMLENICSRKAMFPRSYALRQKEAFINSLPISNITIRDFDRNFTTGSAACIIPVSNADISHNTGIFLGYNFQTNSPMFYDRFIGPPQLSTPHIYISGKSGSGKSVTMKLLTSRSAIAGGIKSIIFDPENEYESIVKNLMGGEHITIRTGEKTGINPLEIEEELDDSGRYVVDIYSKISFIRAMMNSYLRQFAGRTLKPVETTALEEAIKEIYTQDYKITSDPASLYESGGIKTEAGDYKIGRVKKKMPTLSTLHNKIKDKRNCEELYESMKPLVGDGSMSMFDCESTIKLSDNLITSFNLKEIRDEFTKFYTTFILLDYTWTKFVQKDKKRKSVIIDEAWLFIKYPESARFLEEIARRGRKYHASLVVATQNIEEFILREEGRAVINACSTQILLQQNPQVVSDIVKSFKLSEGCASLLETFAPGEAIVVMEGTATAVRITPTNFEWEYITTNPLELE